MEIKMFICVKILFLFFGIGQSSPINPREINLAIESSFYVDPQDAENNGSLLEKIKNFIDKLQFSVDPQTPNNRRTAQKDIFTDFLTELGISVMNFDDDEFSKLAKDLKDVTDNKSKTREFNQVFPDEIFKLFLKLTVAGWTKTDPTKLKLEVARYVTNTETAAIVSFFRNLNKYFTETDEKKFKEIVKTFKEAKKQKEFKDVLNEAVEYIIFDKFKKADKKIVNSFNYDVRKLIEHVKGNVKSNILSKVGAKDSFESFVEKQTTGDGKELVEEVQIFVRNDLKDKSNEA